MIRSTYRVVVNGALLPGFQHQDVKTALSRLFCTHNEQLQVDALFSGGFVTIKRDLCETQAKEMAKKLHHAGLQCNMLAGRTYLEE